VKQALKLWEKQQQFYIYSINICLQLFFFPFQSVVKCPSIEAPSYGMVSPSACQIPSGAHYKAECYFMCNVTVGYQLEGVPMVTCLESGSWSDDTTKTICKGMTK